MVFNKKQGKFIHQVIEQWAEQGTVPPEMAARLHESITIRPFDWKKLAKYSFWTAIICFVIAVAAILRDEVLIGILKQIFTASAMLRSLMLALCAAGLFYLGFARRRRYPHRIFSTEAVFFVGILFCSGSIASFGEAVDTGSGHFLLLFLLSTLVYGVLGLALSSKLIWAFSLLSLGSWFGTETGYLSGWGAYWLGMNFPMRFVLFGLVLTGVSFWFRHVRLLKSFSHVTQVIALLYPFIALWLLSIFGNYGDLSDWTFVGQIELLHWGLLFALAAIAAIVFGLKYDDYTSRAFGVTFLFINLYTRYFEYFWDTTHKAVFFLILAVSLWALGVHAEKLWTLEFLKTAPTQKPENHK